nr:MAG TPA: tail protein [Caudoviricetes sp.]
MSDIKNVNAAKPKIGGAIFISPVGTELPTNATAKLNAAFKGLGYNSEDGMTNENKRESENIKAWGGDIVLKVQTSKEDNFTFTLIESTNIDTLKMVFGAENVSGTIETGLIIKSNSAELEQWSIVADMILSNNMLKRIVIPSGKISEVGEVSYKDDDAIAYEVTIAALPNSKGDTHYEYIQKA